MGSDPKVDRAAGPQELPQRPVSLDTFEIDRYEVRAISLVDVSLACRWLHGLPCHTYEHRLPAELLSDPAYGQKRNSRRM